MLISTLVNLRGIPYQVVGTIESPYSRYIVELKVSDTDGELFVLWPEVYYIINGNQQVIPPLSASYYIKLLSAAVKVCDLYNQNSDAFDGQYEN